MTKIVKPKTLSAKDGYKLYKKENPDTEIPYWLYKEVISRCNNRISDSIIQGKTLSLGQNLGYIRINKINRTFKNPKPNWAESNKLKKQLIEQGIKPKDKDHPDGAEWLVFYTDPFYLRWGWVRAGGACKVKNHKAYAFFPTSDDSKKAGETDMDKLGNKGKLTLANRINPTLHLRYENNR